MQIQTNNSKDDMSEKYDLTMVRDTRVVATYINAVRDHAERVSLYSEHAPARDVARAVFHELSKCAEMLSAFDSKCTHDHYHPPSECVKA